MEGLRRVIVRDRLAWICRATEQHQSGVFGRAGKGEVADIVRAGAGLLQLLQQFIHRHGGHLALSAHPQRGLQLSGGRACLRVMRLINDHSKVFPFQGLVSDDGFHRVGEGLDRDHHNRRARQQGFRELLALGLG